MGADRIVIRGVGAVSPAGWSSDLLWQAVQATEPLPYQETQRTETAPQVRFRRVPAWPTVPSWMKLPRFRRTTTIGKFAIAAAHEALGEAQLAQIQRGEKKVGVVFCTMNGCVQFSRRFYSEVLDQPLLASPILFPETVYNAPSSHLSSLLGSTEINYTLVGDSNEFIKSLELAAQWLEDEPLDGCLVVAAEEGDWLADEAIELYRKSAIAGEGAAAVFLEKRALAELTEGDVALELITESQNFTQALNRRQALKSLGEELKPHLQSVGLVLDGRGLGDTLDGLESEFLNAELATVPSLSVRKQLGEGFSCTSGWQVVCAAKAMMTSSDLERVLVQGTGLFQQNVALLLDRGHASH